MTDTGGIDPGRLAALDIALNILAALGSSQGVSASEIAAALGADRPWIDAILAMLEHRRMIYRDVLELYWLGPQIVFLGRQLSDRSALNQVSSDALDRLVKEAGENAAVVARENLDVVLVARRDVDDSSRLPPRLIGPRGPLFKGGAAKVLLAYAPVSVIDQVIEAHIHEFTPEVLRSPDKVRELLGQIRSDGYYLSIGEYFDDVFTLNAPIRDSKGHVAATIGVRGLRVHLNPDYLARIKQCVLSAAEQVSSRLR